ncbi:MAG TPA: hypothetical protein VLH81_07865 [Desulfobacterales bacterium]|nr:hypothetical protein [Desulfobacterales bacterium]
MKTPARGPMKFTPSSPYQLAMALAEQWSPAPGSSRRELHDQRLLSNG